MTLREVAFDRDTDVSWDSFVRRYNADLANDFGNLVNRTVSMANRYLGGERPGRAPPATRPLARRLDRRPRRLPDEARRLPPPRRARRALGLRRRGQPGSSTPEQPWDAGARRPKAGDAEAEARLRGVLGDLVEACRLVGARGRAVHARPSAPRVLDQLGYAYPYAADGNGGPPLLERAALGRARGRGRQARAAVPLFPRLEIDAALG